MTDPIDDTDAETSGALGADGVAPCLNPKKVADTFSSL